MCNTLLHKLTFEQCEEIKNWTHEQCMIIVEMARLSNFQVENNRKPGETLLNRLYVGDFNPELVEIYISTVKQLNQPFRPQTKIAVLIANVNYKEKKLDVPIRDCELLNDHLEKLGFNVVTLKNLKTETLKEVLSDIFDDVPEKSYCLVFYAGHGCEVLNIKCIIDVDFTPTYLDYEHCVTENFVLEQMYKCQPAFCMLMMDMCRVIAECKNKEKIEKENIPIPNTYTIISCSTSRGQKVEENIRKLVPVSKCQCTASQSDCQSTAAVTEAATDSIYYYVYNSPYVKALCNHIHGRVSVGALLDKAHEEYYQRMKSNGLNILPSKTVNGVGKPSLHDPVASGSQSKTLLLENLTKIKEKYNLL